MKTQIHPLSRRTFVKRGALAALAVPMWSLRTASSADADRTSAAPLRVAVVTGGHLFDVPNFHKLFRSLPGIEADIQYIDDFVATPAAVRDQYDVVLFCIMLMPTPPDGPVKAAIEHLGTNEQGIVVLHHALLAYSAWPLWSNLVGIADMVVKPVIYTGKVSWITAQIPPELPRRREQILCRFAQLSAASLSET